MTRSLASASIAILLLASVPADGKAQRGPTIIVREQCAGAVGTNTGRVVFNFNCKVTNNKHYSYVMPPETASQLAANYNVEVKAVARLLSEISEEDIQPYQVPARIDQLVREVRERRAEMAASPSGSIPPALLAKANAALEAFDLREASRVWEAILASLPSDRRLTQDVAEKRRAYRNAAAVLMIQYRYDEAIERLQAALALPFTLTDQLEITRSRLLLAEAMIARPKRYEDATAPPAFVLSVEHGTSPAGLLEVIDAAYTAARQTQDAAPDMLSEALYLKYDYLLSHPPDVTAYNVGKIDADPAATFFKSDIAPAMGNAKSVTIYLVRIFGLAADHLASRNADPATVLKLRQSALALSKDMATLDTVELSRLHLHLAEALFAAKQEKEGSRELAVARSELLAVYPTGMHPDFLIYLADDAPKLDSDKARVENVRRRWEVLQAFYHPRDETYVATVPRLLKFGYFSDGDQFNELVMPADFWWSVYDTTIAKLMAGGTSRLAATEYSTSLTAGQIASDRTVAAEMYWKLYQLSVQSGSVADRRRVCEELGSFYRIYGVDDPRDLEKPLRCAIEATIPTGDPWWIAALEAELVWFLQSRGRSAAARAEAERYINSLAKPLRPGDQRRADAVRAALTDDRPTTTF